MEVNAVTRGSFWIMVLFHITSLGLTLAAPSDYPQEPSGAECCSQLAQLTATQVSQWSPEDWSKLRNLTKCCDVSDSVNDSACSYTAELDSTMASEMDVTESWDCCMLVDALMRRPKAQWTSREKQNFMKWNECCVQHTMADPYESTTQSSPMASDCCKPWKPLECRSADEWSLQDRSNYNAWVDCCLENLNYEESEFTPSFVSHSPVGCCTAVQKLFSKSPKEGSVHDEENFASDELRDCKPEERYKDGSNCCPSAAAGQV